jgi:hypothetical protein
VFSILRCNCQSLVPLWPLSRNLQRNTTWKLSPAGTVTDVDSFRQSTWQYLALRNTTDPPVYVAVTLAPVILLGNEYNVGDVRSANLLLLCLRGVVSGMLTFAPGNVQRTATLNGVINYLSVASPCIQMLGEERVLKDQGLRSRRS